MKTGCTSKYKIPHTGAQIIRIALIFTFLLWSAWLSTGCSTLEIYIEKTPTTNQSAVSTLAALMVEGTQEARLATQIASAPTPQPEASLVTGRVCYPSEHIPAMLAFFKNTTNDHLDKLQIRANQSSYEISLPPGEYVAYAWVTSYQVGGMYSKAVPCGLTEECTDHSPQPITVLPGQTTSGIDLCDWVIPIENLPLPPGSELPLP
jgi:hypothetical protein